MSKPTSTCEASLSSSIITRMDDACDRFEMGWRAGLRPRIEDYLGETPDPARATLLHELLVLDLVYRRRLGEQPAPEEYRTRFPESVHLVDAALSQHGSSLPSDTTLTAAFSGSIRVGIQQSGRNAESQRSGDGPARRIGPTSLATTSCLC